jgi:phage tail sheath gpL-like
MAISTGIPTNQLVPLWYATVDGSMAGNIVQNDPVLLIGIMPAAAKAPFNTPIAISTVAYAQDQFGAGSMLERMVNIFFQNNLTQLVYAIGIPEPPAGQPATGSIEILTTATQSGTYTVYVAGQKVQVAVYSTDSAGDIATSIATAINAVSEMPVTATVGTSGGVNQVSFTCRWKGETGNDIKLLENYGGGYAGEVMPTGMTTHVTAMNGGTGQPDFTAAIAATSDLSLTCRSRTAPA